MRYSHCIIRYNKNTLVSLTINKGEIKWQKKGHLRKTGVVKEHGLIKDVEAAKHHEEVGKTEEINRGIEMPKGYEKMRDKFVKDGLSRDAAQKKAARIWNSKHPKNPVTGKDKKRK